MRRIKEIYQYIFYGFLVFLHMITLDQVVATEQSTVWDKLYINFYGVSTGGFSLNFYIYLSIVFLGFAYFYQNKLTKMLNERIYYLLIRERSLYQWFWAHLKYSLAAVFLLLLALFGLTIGIGWLEGKTFDLELTIESSLSVQKLLVHFFLNGFLQLVNYLLILFIFTWTLKQSAYVLAVIGGLLLMGSLKIGYLQWFPSGLNSFGLLETYPALRITGILVCWLLVEILIIFYLFRKREIIF
ncbi:hypothetical protein SAMN04487944_11551 [Gracilibacillus ureilyticus]|uniref:ABC-2 type transport system permease protein n=1 Tax=Gracilibacillus ureilyticus TaxID=531814 RepID=A0A1H9TYA0_9BACI|nr:hypothetical protein [Gracilibacillus ureilyticus]SES01944.1 hypothetical protein SAMN04487944_11551 [Gracilibacillus ureilyticus]